MSIPLAGLEGVGGVLLDVDGTLLHADRALPGAAQAIDRIREADIPFRLTTNTTRRSRMDVADALRRAGIVVLDEEIVVPAFLARRRIVESGRPRACLLVPGRSLVDFEGVEEDDQEPDWIVVGDLAHEFTFERMNQAFRGLLGGARLLALHRNRFWHTGERLQLDAGAYVAALEYAAGVEAEVVGKPSRGFFELALGELGVPASEVAVVGDDPDSDAAGGHAAGCRTVLVRTGKFSEAGLARAGVRPDAVLDSMADL